MSPCELVDSPFIPFSRAAATGLHDTIIGVCIDAGFSPNIVQEAHAWLSVVGLIDSGLGITIAPASAAQICPPSVACIPLIGTRELAEIAIVYRVGVANPLVGRFREVVRQSLSDCLANAIEPS